MVSVCIATYNGGKYIKEQVDSILCQLRDDDEIVISDDSSTDGTLQILSEYNDARIRILPFQKFHSPIYNFENAIKHANGNYIFLADQDDIWLPNKLSLCLELLGDNDLVLHDCTVVDHALHLLYRSFFELNGSASGFWKNIYKSSYIGCCIAFRVELLEYILPFPKNMQFYHDGWICSIAEIYGKVFFFPAQLILYRRSGDNVSMTAEKSSFSVWKKIHIRLNWVYLVFLRWIKYKYK